MTGHPTTTTSGAVVAPSPESQDSSFLDMDIFTGHNAMFSLSQVNSKQFSTYPHRSNAFVSQLPMAQFFSEDAPWSSLKATESRPQNLVSGRNGPLPYYGHFRDGPAPSEGDDSGYYGSASASGTKRSVMDLSLDETQSIDTSVHLPMSEMHLQTSRSPDAIHTGGNYRRGEWDHPAANSEVNEFYCVTCKQSLKTKAELNKHKQRHDKPYRCEVSGCGRKEGFGTSNDLDRHKKSVHKADGIKYRCTLGPCESKDKIWPRADNFRSHLKRVHKMVVNSDDPMARFIYELLRAEDLACMGPSEVQIDATSGSAPLSHSAWILDQVHASTHGLPSGGIGFGQMDDAMQFHGPRGSEGEHDHSTLMGVDEIQIHDQEDPMHTDDIHMEMDPALAFGNLQRHGHDTGSTSPELYAYKPDILSQSSSAEQRCLDGSSAELARAEDDELAALNKEKRQKDLQKDKPCTQEPAEQPGPQDSTQDSIVEDDTQDVDAEADSSDDDYKDDDQAAALNAADSQELFPGLQSSSSSCNDDSSSPPEPADESPSCEPQLALDVSLENAIHVDEDKASAWVLKLIENGKLSMEKLGYQKVKKAEVEGVKETPTSSLLVSGDRIRCSDPGCEKTFSRPCELKKHMKRHDKPYACTHTGCDKHFGSKNDWKRHENSQHTQLEFWKCGEKAKDHRPGGLCGKICHRRETFKNHLGKDHQIKDTKAIEKQLQDCRVGRNYESRFWCGFCAQTIDFKKNGGLACSERFDHIDDHFTGKGQPKRDIREWKSIEEEPAETFEQILPEETRGLKNFVPVSTSVLNASARLPPLRDADSRKRAPDSTEDDNGSTAVRESKRHKNDDTKTSVLWLCCDCSDYWSPAVTMTCMGSDCGHAFCDECQMVRHTVKD
ncbi:hypothetical protein B0H67DRAFT_160672 [Lasiosphaeris hirsuta]|uniref:C2H2-type domain-containing protein n=1 Tax=Lasiosphaeris hirsuta TaxID=260670 RepID=A0AA40APL7_9PEZI|nr:hypothetical protein B0H67DRAFT_160672 [Lasiosphaeris hirsuta]